MRRGGKGGGRGADPLSASAGENEGTVVGAIEGTCVIVVTYRAVQSAVGTGKWLVLWDGDGEPLESSRAHLRLVREDEVSVRLVRGCRSGAGAFPRAARHPHAQRAGCAVMPTRDCYTVCRLLYRCLAG